MSFFNTEDRAVTIKYLADLRESTPFTALGENYLEQLKATMNYSPILRTRELKLINLNLQTSVEPEDKLFIIHELIAIQLDYFSDVRHNTSLDTKVTEYPFVGYGYNKFGIYVLDDDVSFYAVSNTDFYAQTFQMTFTPSKDGKTPLDGVPTKEYSIVEMGRELRIPLSEFKSHKVVVNIAIIGI